MTGVPESPMKMANPGGGQEDVEAMFVYLS
jgi:hypothetical protein